MAARAANSDPQSGLILSRTITPVSANRASPDRLHWPQKKDALMAHFLQGLETGLASRVAP
jgi:hypothetical protein